MENPCYNRQTKTDCPDRKCGCQVTCPKWAKYVEERDKEYEQRTIHRVAKEIQYSTSYVRKLDGQKIFGKWWHKKQKKS